MVDRDDDGHAELPHIGDVPAEIGAALLQRLDILRAEIFLLHPAIHLQRPDGRDDHRRSRLQPGLAALDVEEFLCPEIGAEARFRHHIVAELQRRLRRHHRIAAMGDIGEGAAMDEGRIVLQRLHEVRLHRILQQHRHRAVGLEVAGMTGVLSRR